MSRTLLHWARRALKILDGWGFQAGTWPGDLWATRVNSVQAVVWAAFAGAVLVRAGHFTYDQAYFYEHALRTAERLRFPGYGPFISGARGSPLIPGGLLYCVFAVPFIVFRDPRWGHAWLLLLSLLGMLLLDRALRRLPLPPAARIGTLVLLNWSLAHARATETFWNGDVFTFATPALLWAATRLRDEPGRGLVLSALFGLLAALELQIHLSGGMAVLLASVVLLLRPGALRWHRAGTALAAFLLAYLPFVVVDAQANFIDWKLLRMGAAPTPQLLLGSLVRSLLAPVVQASDMELLSDLVAPVTGWQAFAIWTTGVVAVALVALGGLTRFAGKHLSILALLGLPVFFFLTGRGYFEHYVVSVVPFICLPAGVGAGQLLASAGFRRWIAAAYLGSYVVVGGVLLVVRGGQGGLDTWNPWRGMNVAWQLERTRDALARAPAPSGPGDELAFVRWVVAKRLLGRELRFAVGPFLCTPEIRISGVGPPVWQETTDRLLPLAGNSVFVCSSPDNSQPH